MRIWITGHLGMVGSALTKILSKKNNILYFKTREELDLTKINDVRSYLSRIECDWIFVAAGKVGGILENSKNPLDFFYDNFMINNNILRVAYEKKIKKVMVLGSSCMYPINIKQPYQENSLFNGKVEQTNEGYGLSKLMTVKLAEFYNIQHKCNFISVIPCATYGPNDSFIDEKNHVIPALIKKFFDARVNNKPFVKVWGTGEAYREFLFVDDLAEGLVFLMNNYNDPKPINIGSSHEIQIKTLAIEIADLIGFKGDIIFDSNMPEGVMRKYLDSSRLQRMGWKAKTDSKTGLMRTIENFKKMESKNNE